MFTIHFTIQRIKFLPKANSMDSTQARLAFVIKRMRDRRMEKNYTQAYVASKLGISQNAYSKIESGLTNFSIERLYDIADILEVDIKELL